MAREGDVVPRPGPAPCEAVACHAPGAARVLVAGREFLVIHAFSKTMLFERISRPSALVLRREVAVAAVDPLTIATGYLLSPSKSFDPLTDLQERLDRSVLECWARQAQVEKLKAALSAKGAEKRERVKKHGRRNP